MALKDEAMEWDILVIGGGATGVGVALDAATRGLSVALVEGEDFSSGSDPTIPSFTSLSLLVPRHSYNYKY